MSVTDMSAATPATRAPEHHIPAELLLDYAGGTLPEAWSLAIACHLTLCPHCRRDLAAIEQAAGNLVDETVPSARTSGFEAIAGRLGAQEPKVSAPAAAIPASADAILPRPLRDYLGGRSADEITWRWSGAGLAAHPLPLPRARGGIASLMRIAPGASLPLHTHRGGEMTLVLSGGYTDEHGSFQRGDLEIADGTVEHRPIAMLGQPCICLAITDAPLNFRGRFGWFFNQWAKVSA